MSSEQSSNLKMFEREFAVSKKRIKIGFLGKRDINLHKYSFRNHELASNNKFTIAKHIDKNLDNLIALHQIHSDICYVVSGDDYTEKQGDGLVTTSNFLPLTIQTADCVPLIFFDKERIVIGAAHAGWKGAAGGIIESVVKSMLTQGAKIDDLAVIIGPCIHQDSYEVDNEFYQKFLGDNLKNSEFFMQSKKQGHYMFDLLGYCKKRLQDVGIKDMTDVNSNTYSNEDLWFSYRRCTHREEKLDGHNLSYVVIL